MMMTLPDVMDRPIPGSDAARKRSFLTRWADRGGGARIPVQADLDHLTGLLSRVGAGDRAAFRLLYQASSRRLYGFILKILRDPSRAQDVLQDVYLRIWQRASTYSADLGDPLAWMIAISRNRALDDLRSLQRRAPETPVGQDTLDSFAGFSVDRDAQGALSHCLGLLEDQHRSCILLAYVHGYSREELATRFSCPVNTIKTWLHRSLATLKSCMGSP